MQAVHVPKMGMGNNHSTIAAHIPETIFQKIYPNYSKNELESYLVSCQLDSQLLRNDGQK